MFPSFLDQDEDVVARQLLGCLLVRQLDGQEIVVKIVETESYDQTDPASHSYRGQTPRTSIMFGPSGVLYVYFTYGMHYCCNVVTGPDGVGSAVLIRAVEPVAGVDILEARREMAGPNATNGPAKLCQALAIDSALNRHDLKQKPLQLILGDTIEDSRIARSPRIGIRNAADALRRWYIVDSPYISRPHRELGATYA